MSEWQKIETAPKDGTGLIGRDRYGNVFDMRYWTPEQIAEDEDEGLPPDEYQGGWYRLRDSIEQIVPWHWMPLPELPHD